MTVFFFLCHMKTSMLSVILFCNYATGDLKHHYQEKSLPCLFKRKKIFLLLRILRRKFMDEITHRQIPTDNFLCLFESKFWH